MAAAVFTKAAGSGIYWSVDETTIHPFGFLASASTAPSLSLAQIWLDSNGVFFAVSGPFPSANLALFEQQLRTWLATHNAPTAGQRILWVTMSADSSTVASVLPLAVEPGVSPATLAASVTFDFAGYLVDVQSATLAPSPTGDALVLQGAIVFSADSGVPATYPVIGQRASIAVAGDQAGSLSFAIDLPHDGSDGHPTDFERLSIGIRYGWASDDVEVDYLHLPTIAQPAGTTRLWATLQPLDVPAAPGSRFSFLPIGMASATPVPSFESTYVTPEGRAVSLTPTMGSDALARSGGLVFGVQPIRADGAADAPSRHYLTLDGDYTMTVDGLATPDPGQSRLLCGLTTLEQVQGIMPAALRFTPGPAFSPAPATPLTSVATTAWLAVGGPAGATYRVQPDAAPFYTAVGSGNFLAPVDIVVATLPAATPTVAVQTLPMLGYAGLDAAMQQVAIKVERTMLAATRAGIVASTPDIKPDPAPPAWGLTPQGLTVGFETDTYRDWAWMGLANVAGVTQPDIAFDKVTAPLQQAVQNAGPFVVMADPAKVKEAAQVIYQLTAAQVTELQTETPPCFGTLSVADWAALTALTPTKPGYEADFVQVMKALPWAVTADQLDVLLRVAGQLQALIDGWTFDLAPHTWPPAPADETIDDQPETRQGIMVLKLDQTLSLRSWIDQLPASSWLDAAIIPNGTIDDTRQVFLDAIAIAEARRAAAPDPSKSPYAHFLDHVLIDQTWTGMLMLNAAVPLDTLPPDLQAIRAGIVPELFYAHHIGFERSLVNVGADNQLALSPDRMFGVIDYEDPQDLVLDADSSADFQFKVLQLTIGFERSKVASFVGRIELFINHLFGATTRKYPTTVGNNLILNGLMVSEVGDDGTPRTGYRFGSDEDNVYQLIGSALQTVSIEHTALSQNSALSSSSQIVTDFTLGGGLMFQPAPGFDMFSYGPPPPPPPPNPAPPPEYAGEVIETPFGTATVVGRFDVNEVAPARSAAPPLVDADPAPDSQLDFIKLVVRMTYDLHSRQTTFALLSDDATFDTARSTARRDGLAGRFPAVPLRFVKGSGLTPQSLGYDPASCGVQQAKLDGDWYAIEYQLPLGTLGALGGNVTITLTILAAWGVDATADVAPVFLGVRLPGAGITSFELALQGILKLGFGAIQFDTYTAEDGGLGYLLRLRNFGLHVLGQSFPKGAINVLISGAPQATGPGKLGWFAGYVEPDAPPAAATINRRRRLAIRPAPVPHRS